MGQAGALHQLGYADAVDTVLAELRRGSLDDVLVGFSLLVERVAHDQVTGRVGCVCLCNI
ncbi:hypothetical protein D3C72_2479900 [compost metagenome]